MGTENALSIIFGSITVLVSMIVIIITSGGDSSDYDEDKDYDPDHDIYYDERS